MKFKPRFTDDSANINNFIIYFFTHLKLIQVFMILLNTRLSNLLM